MTTRHFRCTRGRAGGPIAPEGMQRGQNAVSWRAAQNVAIALAIPMDLLRIYARVLTLLGPEARLGWLLAVANLALAGSQFAEPGIFGRIIDALAGSERVSAQAPAGTIVGLMAAWIGFGLFSIAAGVTIALHSDRLAHRRLH